MPVFFQQQINEHTRLGIWKIEETEEFFRGNVPQHREVTHRHKRLQHLAGRFLLQFLFPDFPYEMIRIADTRKPFLKDERYHFSISHCGDYAAAIVSSRNRVGVDVEQPVKKILRIKDKFLSLNENKVLGTYLAGEEMQWPTVFWSAKEAVFKWHGEGGVDFRGNIHLLNLQEGRELMDCYFSLTGSALQVHYRLFNGLVLAWVVS